MNKGNTNSYEEIVGEIDDKIEVNRQPGKGKSKSASIAFGKMFSPIYVSRFYIPGTNSSLTDYYYDREIDKKMFDEYSSNFNGYPPLVFRNQNDIRRSMNDYKYVKIDNMIGVIIEYDYDHFIVEPKGLRSRLILEKLIGLGYSARYELMAQTKDIKLRNVKSGEINMKKEVYGRSRIVAIDMLP